MIAGAEGSAQEVVAAPLVGADARAEGGMSKERISFCRFCHAYCPIRVTIEDGRPVKVIGVKENPMYHGYTCIKGRELPRQHDHPDRLLHSRVRGPDGSHDPIAVEDAMDSIAERLSATIRDFGPDSVALYSGTFSYLYPSAAALGQAFIEAIGSRWLLSPTTIDQPGKPIAQAFHGRWGAGPQTFADADVWMLVGTNPLVSKWGGIPQFNPARHLHEARKRGLRLIVVDPRRTESAEKADVFLQPRPGEDPTILAGIVRVILEEGLADEAFLARHVEGVEALREAVRAYTPDYVARRAGISAEDLVAAARVFAGGTRGMVSCGTGPNMAPRGTLTEYLVLVINTLCGRWIRDGERVPNPFVFLPDRPFVAQAQPRPKRAHGDGRAMRVRGLRASAAGLPISAIPDEILLEGEGQIRALLVLGGNPMAAWPDPLRTLEAFQALPLSVAVDPWMSATARLCDYVIAPKLGLETPGITSTHEKTSLFGVAHGYPAPYGHYVDKVVDPPEGAEVIEDWELFYGLAQRMGLSLRVAGQDLDMESKPTGEEIYEILCRDSRIPLDEVKRHPIGHIFDDRPVQATPAEVDWPHRLDVGAPEMLQELAEVRAEAFPEHAGYAGDPVFSHRLVGRRMDNVYNSSGHGFERLTRKHRYNPAFMHPEDLETLGLAPGDLVEIRSSHGVTVAVVETAPDVRPGVVSMSHAWGGLPGEEERVREIGSNTGLLSSIEERLEPRSGIPLMSAIPVDVRRVEAADRR